MLIDWLKEDEEWFPAILLKVMVSETIPCHIQNNGLYLTTVKNNLLLTTW